MLALILALLIVTPVTVSAPIRIGELVVLLAAFVVVPFGQSSVAWFALGSLVGIIVLWHVGSWYQAHRLAAAMRPVQIRPVPFSRRRIAAAILILVLLFKPSGLLGNATVEKV